MTEQQLLRNYVQTRSDDVFAHIVEAHVGMVYSVALRRVRDRHLAEDVTQATFVLLAQKAADIRDARALPNWLFKAACHASANLLRAQSTRRRNENEAAAMRSQEHREQSNWQQLLPELDAAMVTLEDNDREAILLRFYEQRSLREVGDLLGVSEDAARKRVGRAVDRLRLQLVPGGALSMNLAAVLANYRPAPVPGDLIATTVANACQAAGGIITTGAVAKGATLMALAHTKFYVALAALTLSAGAIVAYQASDDTPALALNATPVATPAPAVLPAPVVEQAISNQSDIASAIAQLELGRSKREDVVRLLGEPEAYTWNRQTFTPANLPETYLMNYPGAQFGVRAGTLIEVRINDAAAYAFDGRLRVGSSVDEAIEVLGTPKEVIKGKPLAFTDGVLLLDINQQPGFDYYQQHAKGIRLFFRDHHVSELCLIPAK